MPDGFQARWRSRLELLKSGKFGAAAEMIQAKFIISGIVFLIVASGVMGREAPVKVLESSVLTSHIKRGDPIALTREVKWLRSDCVEAKLSADLIDSLGYHHATDEKLLGVPRGDFHSVSREWAVPFNIPWGPTKYHGSLSFSCFPFYGFWPVQVPLPELIFNVDP